MKLTKPHRLPNRVAIATKGLLSKLHLIQGSSNSSSAQSVLNDRQIVLCYRFSNLPPEIILHIAEFLDQASLLCLAITNSRLRAIIPVPEVKDRHPCAQWLFGYRYEEDHLRKPSPQKPLKIFKCAFCKKGLSFRSFSLPSLREFITGVRDQTMGIDVDVMRRGPVARYCALYPPPISSFTIDLTKKERKYRDELYWTRVLKRRCMHCGGLVASDDQREAGCRQCGCNICPQVMHYAYI